MKPDEIIYIVVSSRQIIIDMGQLNALYRVIEDIEHRRGKIIDNIYNNDISTSKENMTMHLYLVNSKKELDDELQNMKRERDDIVEKIRLFIECRISPRKQRGSNLLACARRFYDRSRISDLPGDQVNSERYRKWASEFLSEALQAGCDRSEAYFLSGCIYEDSCRFSDAYDYFAKSFYLDNKRINSLEGIIRTCRRLIEQGHNSKRTELEQWQIMLDEISLQKPEGA